MNCEALLTDLLLRRRVPPDADAHLGACPHCRADAPVARALAALFDAAPAPAPPSHLIAGVLRAAAPLLAANARRLPAAAWPRLAGAIAVAALPLPLILFAGWTALHAMSGLLTSVLPETLGLYLIATHATVLAFLLGVTYGAVPLLAAHQLRLQHEETHV
jgi:hypothetical protein